MKNVIWLYLFICISTLGLKANDLQITNLSFSDVNNTITFDVQWDNSWHDATGNFHDAVWVFVKYRTPGSQWKHANILFSGTPPTGMSIVTPVDRKGAFIRRSTQGLGNVAAGTYKFNIINSLGVNPSFKVFGVEMVYIPTGSFYIGGPSGTNRYLHDPNDVNAGILIQSEAAIPASSFTVTGTLSYDDDIPASYPKGYNSFYCMKYKISQRQYVEFLNTLNTTQQNERVESVLSQSIINRFVMCDNFAPQGRNGIYFVGTSDEGNYLFGCDLNNNGVINQVDDGQEISCNYLNREDYLAYLDWSALRVPTRLEIWKICRGPEMVIDSEMAWGSNIVNEININDVTNLDTSSEMLPTPVNGPMYEDAPLRTGIFANSSSNRFNSGATYYGVMDMTIGMLEYCTGLRGDDLNYIGNLGDGELTVIGESNEIDFLLSQIYGQSNINVLDGVLVVSRADFTTGGRGVR